MCATIDGAEVGPEGWLCMDYPHTQNPDDLFPGWKDSMFADGDWYAPKVRETKH